MRIVKTYEGFLSNKRFKFEENIIDPILILIRDNQEYLTMPENLPQLAKLGYMYNTLWYDGRLCWGSDGILLDPILKKEIEESDYDDDDENNPYQWISCEDNPKYKIEMCDPINDEISDLIYDAWGLHTEGDDPINYETFINTINGHTTLTNLQIKELKINKTMEDWIEIKMDPSYKYNDLFPNKKRVLDYLLCTIGNGYGWNKEGFIIEEASGADQDVAIYGDWKNAKFDKKIESEVNRILSIPELKETINAAFSFRTNAKNGKSKSIFDHTEINKMVNDIMNNFKTSNPNAIKKTEKYKKYYPISKSSKIYAIIDKEIRDQKGIVKIDQSYIDAAIEICNDILLHDKEEEKANVEFAKKLLTKLGIKDYSTELPKEFDKYKLQEEIEDSLIYITDHFRKSNNTELSSGEFFFYLNDSKTNTYADNSYNLMISLDGMNLPIGYYKGIEFLKSTSLYKDMNTSIHRLKQLDDVKYLTIYADTVPDSSRKLYMRIITDPKIKHFIDVDKFENDLISEGFQIGLNSCALELNNYILTCRKPSPLGSGHPDSKTGKEIFSNAHEFCIRDKNWVNQAKFYIDERRFNTLTPSGNMSESIKKWVVDEFNKMKNSDPKYGTYGIEGKEYRNEGKVGLYAHNFFLWLKNNQI